MGKIIIIDVAAPMKIEWVILAKYAIINGNMNSNLFLGDRMKIREEYTCPLELVHDMIKGKWKSIILWRLRLGATSLAKLERDIDGINQKMLLEQLKELIDYRFVEKKTFEGYPLHVEYSLTIDMGMAIIEALKIMQSIGIDYLKEDGMEKILIEKGVIQE